MALGDQQVATPAPGTLAGGAPPDEHIFVNAPNPTPQPFTDSDLNPASATAGQTSLAGIPLSQTRSNPNMPPPGSFGHKVMQAADQLGINPRQPMGWAASLVGAAQRTLANLGNISTEGAGPGIIQGVAGTSKNINNQRQMAKEQVDKAAQQAIQNADEKTKMDILQAHANNDKIQQERVTQQLDWASQDEIAKHDINEIARQTTEADDPAEVVANGLTQGELQQKISSGEISKTATMNPLRDGKKIVGTDPKTNLPIYEPTFTLLRIPKEMTVEPEDVADFKKYAGKDISAGTVIPGQTWNWLKQQVAGAKTVEAARAKTLADAGIEAEKTEANNLVRSPEWLHVLGQTPGLDPVKALETFVGNPTLAAKFPKAAIEVPEYYGGQKNWSALIKESAGDEKNPPLGEKVSQLNQRLTDRYQVLNPGKPLPKPYTLPDDATQKDYDEISKDMEHVENAEGTKEQRNIANSMRQEAMNLQAGTATPTGDRTKRGDDYLSSIPDDAPVVRQILEGRSPSPSGTMARSPYWVRINQEVAQADPQFNTQRYDLTKSLTTGKGSQEINAVNVALGHVGVLNDAIDALNNGNVKVLNSIANRYGVEVGKTPVTTFNTIVHRLGPELTKAYLASGGSVGERGTNEEDFNANLGAAQLKTNAAETVKLLRSKIGSYENQWNVNKGAGMTSFENRFLMPDAKKVLNQLAPENGQPSTVSGITNMHITPSGQKIGVLNGAWVDAATGKPLVAKGQ
jgi:hypothetical protein